MCPEKVGSKMCVWVGLATVACGRDRYPHHRSAPLLFTWIMYVALDHTVPRVSRAGMRTTAEHNTKLMAWS